MRKEWICLLSLAVLVCFINNATAQEARKITCSGKVVDADGQPIAGAKVRFFELVYRATYDYETNLVEEVITKPDGAFSFSITADTEVSRYGIIVAEKQGLAIGCANWQMRQDQESDIRLSEPKDLAGVVVDESDKPIGQVEVSIYMLLVGERDDRRYLTSQAAPKLLTVRTDAAGKFAFTNLPVDANAEFLLKKTGWATVNTWTTSASLKYKPGQTDIKLTQPIEAKIEGIVVEKGTGKPVPGVKLMVLQEQNRPLPWQEPIVSNEDGTFSINALTAGSYILQIVPPRDGLADWVAEPVEVVTEKGKTTGNVKVQVSKGGILEVVVTEAVEKKPIEKASVSIHDEERNQRFSARSDKDGIARIRLTPGEYRLSSLYKQGYSRSQQEETIAIEDNKTARLEMQLTETPKITGVVRDESGKTVEGAKLKVYPTGRGDATSDAQGKFEVKWDPRSWGSSEEMVCYLVARQPERNLAAAVEIQEDTKTLDIKLLPGLIFTGKVVDPEEKGIPDAKINVMLRVSNWGAPITDWRKGGAITDAEGKFEVKAIPLEHKYNVGARADDYGQNSIEVHTDNAVDNRLEVGQLTLAVANLSVSGVVVDVDDKPVANARLHCYGDGQPNRNVTADAEGKFTIEKICEGRIQVSASISGKTRLQGYVETDGGATEVKIVVTESVPSTRLYVPKQPPSLVGKPLPELKDLKIQLPRAEANDKMLLVCFWDMQQRPSRHCIRQLAQKAEELKQKGVIIVSVQASKIEENALNEWAEKYNIPFPVGIIEADEEKTRFAWGVKSLPWLILTDTEHTVRAEGFALTELDEKLKKISGE